MKRSFSVIISAVLLFIVISIPAAIAAQDSSLAEAPKANNEVKLTDAQKNELKQLSDKMFEAKRQMVQKYLEYGVITKEQAEKKLERIEKMRKFKEENGFMPGKGKGKGWDKKKHNRQQESEG